MIPLLTALLAAVLGGLLSPALRPFLQDDSERVGSLLRVPVAVLAALAGFGAASVADSAAELVAFAAVGVGCALLVVIDLMVRRLPDVLVACTAVALLVPLAVAAATADEWSTFGRSLLAAVVLLAGYFLLALIAPSGLGLGDVKFAFLVGGFLGWFGWSHVAAGTVLGFTINGVIALLVLASRNGGRDTQIPFGPSMALGAVCAVALLP
ncbi:A24 family peptidase [Nesterenkonia sp. LB17]|uniref:prepilin peptidase n=1 Tax=Nesterenkonia sp. LB17 TaxID=2901230 RepID=UPI001F4C815F|nr:A24 family peptidase [Nesterenkonia sp. LB17]MCH8566092.1 A24 family peptidase [Nesterenkonia sp. LB17]